MKLSACRSKSIIHRRSSSPHRNGPQKGKSASSGGRVVVKSDEIWCKQSNVRVDFLISWWSLESVVNVAHNLVRNRESKAGKLPRPRKNFPHHRRRTSSSAHRKKVEKREKAKEISRVKWTSFRGTDSSSVRVRVGARRVKREP